MVNDHPSAWHTIDSMDCDVTEQNRELLSPQDLDSRNDIKH
ncbi:MAG: hypothetical protein ACYSVY_00430 [Planctomycetota bacterium]